MWTAMIVTGCVLVWYWAAWWMMRSIRRRARLETRGMFWWWITSPVWFGPLLLPALWVCALNDSGFFHDLSARMFK